MLKILTHLLDDGDCPLLHLALGSIKYDHPGGVLTKEEEERYSAFSNDKRKREYISTRSLIKELGRHAGLDPERLEIRKDEKGKPFGRYEGSRLYVSIAHTDKKILCAMSEHADVGVDIEPAGRTVSKRLRNRILNPSESQLLDHVESIRLWTIKEATVKLLGSGLRTNLCDLAVQSGRENSFFVCLNQETRASVNSFQYQGYWISVAYYV